MIGMLLQEYEKPCCLYNPNTFNNASYSGQTF